MGERGDVGDRGVEVRGDVGVRPRVETGLPGDGWPFELILTPVSDVDAADFERTETVFDRLAPSTRWRLALWPKDRDETVLSDARERWS